MRTWDHSCINSRVGVLVVTLPLVSCVLSLGFTTHTQYQVQRVFLLDVVVQFGRTVFCDRQFFSVANFCTLFHRENGSFEVLSLQNRQSQRTSSAAMYDVKMTV